MTNEELIKKLRDLHRDPRPASAVWLFDNQVALYDAAAAIEALQAEVKSYKALVENKERLLGLYRAEQAKHFYSATEDDGRVIQNPCAFLNIPVFPDSSESPNS